MKDNKALENELVPAETFFAFNSLRSAGGVRAPNFTYFVKNGALTPPNYYYSLASETLLCS